MQSAGDYDLTIKSIEALIEDVGFQHLNQKLSESTLFDVLGISLEERTHSKMLGWLLEPTEGHGLGSDLLRRLLYTAAKLARSEKITYGGNGYPITPLQAETFSYSDVRLRSEYSLSNDRRLDLILWSVKEKWLCVIENKILSEEGEEQTTSYYEELLDSFPPERFRNRLFIYLSPEGLRPESRRFVRIDYSTIARLLDEGGPSASDLGRLAIDQYVRCLKGRIVEREQLQEICWRLYRNHRAAIDAITRYGGVNILATKTAEQVLEVLRRDDGSASLGSHVEWESNRGSGWIAIRPRHWPRKPIKYAAFYKIVWDEPQGQGETIQVGLGFDKPELLKVKAHMERLATDRGLESILPLVPIKAEDLSDLSRAVQEASDALVNRVVSSFSIVEEALRLAFPEWTEPTMPNICAREDPPIALVACGGTGEALQGRCAAILEQIAPERFDGKNALQFSPAESHVGLIYLRPLLVDQREDGRRAESICLEMFPAMTVPQALKFYLDVMPARFAGGLVGKEWTVRPWLTFRCRADIRCQPDVLVDAERYFSFWQSHPEMIRGERDRELVATEWWDAWVSAGMVRPEDREQIRRRFSEKQKVNVCPGFRLRYSWPLQKAERLDSLRTSPGSQQTVFVAAVRDKIREAFQAIGQDFDSLARQGGVPNGDEDIRDGS